jgi:hypothetical protein
MDWLCGTQDGFMAAGGYDGYYAKKKLQLQKEGEKEAEQQQKKSK